MGPQDHNSAWALSLLRGLAASPSLSPLPRPPPHSNLLSSHAALCQSSHSPHQPSAHPLPDGGKAWTKGGLQRAPWPLVKPQYLPSASSLLLFPSLLHRPSIHLPCLAHLYPSHIRPTPPCISGWSLFSPLPSNKHCLGISGSCRDCRPGYIRGGTSTPAEDATPTHNSTHSNWSTGRTKSGSGPVGRLPHPTCPPGWPHSLSLHRLHHRRSCFSCICPLQSRNCGW